MKVFKIWSYKIHQMQKNKLLFKNKVLMQILRQQRKQKNKKSKSKKIKKKKIKYLKIN